uniref:Complex 1 LYR protein domain-containing protein n=1 Tax=Pseudo-nitzschia australis TaxID=44445 RepID=A0A7S4EE58_9STRA|mmetsp:Transcript_3587/g.7713  ORF Transcript_3587/g.7713 Transcript_3587/m.7713 type:complete len:109 (-) Transcript_3587:527-853(-)
MSGIVNRTALELYRDCFRLVRHIAPGESPKAMALRQTVRMQFKAHAKEEDPTKIEAFKSDAVRALSNYMVYQSAQKDDRLQKAMNLDSDNIQNKSKKKDGNNDDMDRL